MATISLTVPHALFIYRTPLTKISSISGEQNSVFRNNIHNMVFENRQSDFENHMRTIPAPPSARETGIANLDA